jgi:hypothetical protein
LLLGPLIVLGRLPDAGFQVMPIKGNALFFSYDRPHPMTRTRHGGAPVIQAKNASRRNCCAKARFSDTALHRTLRLSAGSLRQTDELAQPSGRPLAVDPALSSIAPVFHKMKGSLQFSVSSAAR